MLSNYISPVSMQTKFYNTRFFPMQIFAYIWNVEQKNRTETTKYKLKKPTSVRKDIPQRLRKYKSSRKKKHVRNILVSFVEFFNEKYSSMKKGGKKESLTDVSFQNLFPNTLRILYLPPKRRSISHKVNFPENKFSPIQYSVDFKFLRSFEFLFI